MTNIVIELFTALGLPEEIVNDIDARAYTPDSESNFLLQYDAPDFDLSMNVNDIAYEFLQSAFFWKDSPYKTYYSDNICYNLPEDKFDKIELITKLDEYILAKMSGDAV